MYDDFSAEYDRFVNWPSRLAVELPFIERQFQTAEGEIRPLRVLDAACGTGMHAIALAERGYRAAGADLSAGMIAQARANASAAGVDVAFATAGFGGLAWAFGERAMLPFDALLCLGNSLPHLLTRPDLDLALQDFAACLLPGSLIIIQNRNFDAVMAVRERWMEPQSHREGDTERIFLRFYDFDPGGPIHFNLVTLRRSGAGNWEQRVVTSLLRPLLQAELVEALTQAGFTGIETFGDMTGAPFDPRSSGNLVVTARLKEEKN